MRILEWLAIERAQQAGRYQLENGNAGSKPHTPGPLTRIVNYILNSQTCS